MKARLRVIGILAFLSAPAVVGCAAEQAIDEGDKGVESTQQAVASDQTIYTDAAASSGWASWSWGSTIAFANTDTPLESGSSSQIKVAMTSSWGALSMAHGAADLNVADYDSVAFDIRGPAASTMNLHVETLAGGASGVSATVAVTTTWTRRTVSISSLEGSLSQFGKIDFGATAAGQVFYVDNVKLLAKGSAASSPAPTTTPTPPAPAPAPPQATTYPTSPITVQKANVVAMTASTGPYWLYVPNAYDATHNTPTKVLLWMHGCGGVANGETWTVSPGGAQDWITVSVGGRDNDCWYPNTDVPLALGALADVEKHLNVDPRRVVIGGYSSGGDLAYRTAFYNAKKFAGLLAENTSPFRDTGSTEAASLAAATWKFNVAHLAHLSDTEYPIAGVRTETDAVKAAGFPLTRIELPGTHWDNDTASSGTVYDREKVLLPYIDAGWLAPQ